MEFLRSLEEAGKMGISKTEFLDIWQREMAFKELRLNPKLTLQTDLSKSPQHQDDEPTEMELKSVLEQQDRFIKQLQTQADGLKRQLTQVRSHLTADVQGDLLSVMKSNLSDIQQEMLQVVAGVCEVNQDCVGLRAEVKKHREDVGGILRNRKSSLRQEVLTFAENFLRDLIACEVSSPSSEETCYIFELDTQEKYNNKHEHDTQAKYNNKHEHDTQAKYNNKHELDSPDKQHHLPDIGSSSSIEPADYTTGEQLGMSTKQAEKHGHLATQQADKSGHLATQADKSGHLATQADKPGHLAAHQADKPGHLATQADKPGHLATQADKPGHLATQQADKPGHLAAHQANLATQADKPGHLATQQADKPGHLATQQADKPGHLTTHQTDKPGLLATPSLNPVWMLPRLVMGSLTSTDQASVLFPHSWAFINLSNITKFVHTCDRFHSSKFLLCDSPLMVQLQLLFNGDGRLEVNFLLTKRSNQQLHVGTFTLEGNGLIKNSHPGSYSRLWTLMTKNVQFSAEDKEINLPADVHLKTNRGSYSNITYTDLLDKGYGQGDVMVFKWNLRCLRC